MRPAEEIRAEAALRAADAEQWRATADAEAKAFALSSMPEMIECDADGRTRGLDEVLDDVDRGFVDVAERTIDRVSISMSENVGVLMGREGERRFMHVYLYKDGRWRLMARHLAAWH
jgi:hypothetical protein